MELPMRRMDLPLYLFKVMLPFRQIQQELLVKVSLTKVLAGAESMHARHQHVVSIPSEIFGLT